MDGINTGRGSAAGDDPMIESTLAHYRITGELGSGGMGEVWRAEDEKLGREVALKVLPADVAGDAERLARFEREAKVLASLNHPNIAHLYGLETALPCHSERSGLRGRGVEESPEAQSDAVRNAPSRPPGDPSTRPSDDLAQGDMSEVTFLVMELVEGEDLSDRISRGPISVDEVVGISLQIAEALEAAHESGIVHRDLKPANIKLRADGAVKVLDFGLAKAWEADNTDASLSLSPTMTQHNTAAGVILGTAAYMSPEQARGQSVDRRADIWAFGVVMWEMLTGQKLFEGETVSDVLASVLKEAPPLDALPRETPSYLRRLTARCLDKDPTTRLRDIGEARILLTSPEALETPRSGDLSEVETAPSARLPWVAAAVAGTAVLVLLGFLIARPKPESRVVRFEISPPADGRFHLAPDNPGPVAVSPDGSMLAFSGRANDGTILLWVRALDEEAARSLPGTENAQYPFWSPDSRKIGFFASDKLRVVEAVGGPPLTLCDAPDGKGASWSSEGVIVFAPSYNTPLRRVSQAGGTSAPLTEFNKDRHDNSHRHPRFLPDGKRFFYMARSASGSNEGQMVMVGSLDGAVDRELFRAPTWVEYASGHVLFVRDRTLMARPFDPDRLEFTGDAFPIADSVTLLPPGAVVGVFSASQNGVLAYQRGGGEDGSFHLVWRDREGNELGSIGEPASYDEIIILPGDELAAVSIEESSAGTGDVWVIDLRRDLFTRFTFEPGYEIGLVATPDGSALIYSAERDGEFVLIRKDVGGAGDGDVVFRSKTEVYPGSVSPDGASLVLQQAGPDASYDILVLPLTGDGEAAPLVHGEFNEWAGVVSPDGRWLAYCSDESGRPEVYVTAFPVRGRKWQVSVNGGQAPLWNRDGSEVICHQTDGTLVSFAIEARNGGLLIGEAAPLFNTMLQPFGPYFWAMTGNGERILSLEPTSNVEQPNLSVTIDWPRAAGGAP